MVGRKRLISFITHATPLQFQKKGGYKDIESPKKKTGFSRTRPLHGVNMASVIKK